MQEVTYQAPQIRETKAPPIPKELEERMIAHAKMLRRKFPHMKPDRIKRKVCEYFKVELV